MLATALLGVLLIDPFAVLSAGLWLSFTAVAVILLSVHGRSATVLRGWKHWWWRFGRLQAVVALGLAPLTWVYFSQISVLAPLANLLAVPSVGLVVVPVTLGAVCVLPFSLEFSAFLLFMSGEALQLLWWSLDALERLDLVVDSLPPMGSWVFLSVLILSYICLLPAGVPGRWVGVFVVPLVFFRALPVPPPGGLELTVLDVGQGLSVVVRTHRHTLVFDAGPRYSPASTRVKWWFYRSFAAAPSNNWTFCLLVMETMIMPVALRVLCARSIPSEF